MGWTVYNSSGQILQGSSTLADDAVTTAKILDDAVTVAKLANSINTNIDANTAKTGITSGQASAITANTAKVTNATHSGEVTGATTLTITADAVTNAKLANMAARTVKVNATNGSANPTDIVMADGDFLIANGSALVTVPIAGDVAVSNTGAAVIQTGAVDIAMLSASNHDNARFLRGDNTWQAAGGGVTYEGGNTSEGTSNSTTQSDLLAITSMSIGVNSPVHSEVSLRKSAGAAGQAALGLKINDVYTANAVPGSFRMIVTDGNNSAQSRSLSLWLPPRISLYVGIGSARASLSGLSNTDVSYGGRPTFDAGMPVETIDEITYPGKVDNTGNTIGVDSGHVWSMAIS